MSNLEKLKFLPSARPVGYDPVRSRRTKLVRAIDEQIARQKADQNGFTYRKKVSRRHRDLESDILVEREEQRRVAQWWWYGDDGSINLQLRYGSAAINIDKRGSVVSVPEMKDLEPILLQLRQAALAGELDEPLNEAAMSLSKRFQLKKPKI